MKYCIKDMSEFIFGHKEEVKLEKKKGGSLLQNSQGII
jgi:hypothetical protein